MSEECTAFNFGVGDILGKKRVRSKQLAWVALQPENGGSKLFRNVHKLLTDYMELHFLVTTVGTTSQPWKPRSLNKIYLWLYSPFLELGCFFSF
jgi:hypothetical protein